MSVIVVIVAGLAKSRNSEKTYRSGSTRKVKCLCLLKPKHFTYYPKLWEGESEQQTPGRVRAKFNLLSEKYISFPSFHPFKSPKEGVCVGGT